MMRLQVTGLSQSPQADVALPDMVNHYPKETRELMKRSQQVEERLLIHPLATPQARHSWNNNDHATATITTTTPAATEKPVAEKLRQFLRHPTGTPNERRRAYTLGARLLQHLQQQEDGGGGGSGSNLDRKERLCQLRLNRLTAQMERLQEEIPQSSPRQSPQRPRSPQPQHLPSPRKQWPVLEASELSPRRSLDIDNESPQASRVRRDSFEVQGVGLVDAATTTSPLQDAPVVTPERRGPSRQLLYNVDTGDVASPQHTFDTRQEESQGSRSVSSRRSSLHSRRRSRSVSRPPSDQSAELTRRSRSVSRSPPTNKVVSNEETSPSPRSRSLFRSPPTSKVGSIEETSARPRSRSVSRSPTIMLSSNDQISLRPRSRSMSRSPSASKVISSGETSPLSRSRSVSRSPSTNNGSNINEETSLHPRSRSVSRQPSMGKQPLVHSESQRRRRSRSGSSRQSSTSSTASRRMNFVPLADDEHSPSDKQEDFTSLLQIQGSPRQSQNFTMLPNRSNAGSSEVFPADNEPKSNDASSHHDSVSSESKKAASNQSIARALRLPRLNDKSQPASNQGSRKPSKESSLRLDNLLSKPKRRPHDPGSDESTKKMDNKRQNRPIIAAVTPSPKSTKEEAVPTVYTEMVRRGRSRSIPRTPSSSSGTLTGTMERAARSVSPLPRATGAHLSWLTVSPFQRLLSGTKQEQSTSAMQPLLATGDDDVDDGENSLIAKSSSSSASDRADDAEWLEKRERREERLRRVLRRRRKHQKKSGGSHEHVEDVGETTVSQSVSPKTKTQPLCSVAPPPSVSSSSSSEDPTETTHSVSQPDHPPWYKDLGDLFLNESSFLLFDEESEKEKCHSSSFNVFTPPVDTVEVEATPSPPCPTCGCCQPPHSNFDVVSTLSASMTTKSSSSSNTHTECSPCSILDAYDPPRAKSSSFTGCEEMEGSISSTSHERQTPNTVPDRSTDKGRVVDAADESKSAHSTSPSHTSTSSGSSHKPPSESELPLDTGYCSTRTARRQRRRAHDAATQQLSRNLVVPIKAGQPTDQDAILSNDRINSIPRKIHTRARVPEYIGLDDENSRSQPSNPRTLTKRGRNRVAFRGCMPTFLAEF